MRTRTGTDVLSIGFEEAAGAARGFAEVLKKTPEYIAFDSARTALLHDRAAQQAIQAYQKKQQELSWRWQVGLVEESERQAVEALYEAMMSEPAVKAYVEAQSRLGSLCREVRDLIARETGLDLSAACGPGCSCGG